jgi:hypothetical protein
VAGLLPVGRGSEAPAFRRGEHCHCLQQYNSTTPGDRIDSLFLERHYSDARIIEN